MNLDTYCPIPFSEMFVRNDGRVLICCDTLQSVGNIHEQSLTDIFNQCPMLMSLFIIHQEKDMDN